MLLQASAGRHGDAFCVHSCYTCSQPQQSRTPVGRYWGERDICQGTYRKADETTLWTCQVCSMITFV